MLSDDTSFMNFQLCTTEQHCVEIWVTFWRWLTRIYNKINTDSYHFLWKFIPFVHSGHFQNMFHFLHCPMPSTCPPPLSTHSWHRRFMSFTARRMVPGFCRNTSTSCSILCCKSCRLRGGVTNTLSFRYPQWLGLSSNDWRRGCTPDSSIGKGDSGAVSSWGAYL